MAAFVDLGTGTTLRKKYFVSSDVPSGSVYISIHFDDEDKLVLADSKNNGTFQEFLASDISGLWTPTTAPSFTPILGHIYLFNITDSEDDDFNRVVKLVPLEKSSGTVLFRWDVLKDKKNGNKIPCFVNSDEPKDQNDHHDNWWST